MEYRIIFITVALFCQVQSQCFSSGVISPVVTSPQVIGSPVVGTTIIDNSVANALANALQLLIVSDLIESRLKGSCLSEALLGGIAPIIETVTPVYPPIISVPEYITTCAPSIEFIPTCGPVVESLVPNYYGPIYPNTYEVTETIIPNYLGGYTDIVAPNLCGTPNQVLTPYGGLTEIIIGAPYAPNVYEVIAPNPYGCSCSVQEITAPNYIQSYCGVPEIVTPQFPCSPGCSRGCGEVIIPNPYNPYSSIAEVISPYNPGCGVTEVITPNYYGGLTEVISPISPLNPGCYRGVTEVISPSPCFGQRAEIISSFPSCSPGCGCGATEIITPNCYGGVTEFITPTNPFTPGYYSGLPEVFITEPSSTYCGALPEIVVPCNTEVVCPPQYTSFYPRVTEVSPAFGSNCYGGVKEVISVPCAPSPAEVIVPSLISTPYNYGFMPSPAPCVNIDPLPFEQFYY